MENTASNTDSNGNKIKTFRLELEGEQTGLPSQNKARIYAESEDGETILMIVNLRDLRLILDMV